VIVDIPVADCAAIQNDGVHSAGPGDTPSRRRPAIAKVFSVARFLLREEPLVDQNKVGSKDHSQSKVCVILKKTLYSYSASLSHFWKLPGEKRTSLNSFLYRRLHRWFVDRVRHLAQSLPDGEIADRLHQEGQVSALGKPFTGSMVKWIRYRYQIPKPRLVRPEELTVQQVAERFRVSPNVVYYWIDRGVIQARRLNAGSPYWITLDETDERKLRDWVRDSCRIQMASSTRLEERAL
jgi:hypothetical protein